MDDRMWVTASALVVLACAVLTALAIPSAARSAPRRALLPVVAAEVLVLSVLAPVLAGFLQAPEALAEGLGQLFFPAFALLAATFPDGRFVPRPTIVLVGAIGVVTVANWVAGGRLSEQPWWWVVPTANLLFVVAQVGRYRRSSTTLERERVRWVLLGVLISVPIYGVLMVVDAGVAGTGPASEARANLAILPILLGLAVAMGRPRLTNVDVPLRLVLTGWFAAVGLVPVFWVAGVVTGALGVDAVGAGWWWALAVAAVAYPVVRLANQLADLVVHRGRASPSSAVALLGDRLAAEPDPAAVAATIARVAQEAVRSRGVALEVAPDVATTGDEVPPGADVFEVEFQGEHLGLLRVLPRAGESELVRRDLDALAAIARHAGPALSAARRAGELSVAHSRLVVAREEERRRLRRDLHDDLAPTLSGISLGAAALSRSLTVSDPEHAAQANDLHDDVQTAVLQARQIAYGLRPPVLDDRGLVAAIRDRVLAPNSPVVVDIAGATLPTSLPAAVDLAALRIVQEAVANVRRHANARHCRVVLRIEDAELVVTVADDGSGMPARYQPGMGLTSIRERATELGGTALIAAPPGGGTLVTVRLPLAVPGIRDVEVAQ